MTKRNILLIGLICGVLLLLVCDFMHIPVMLTPRSGDIDPS